MPVKTNNRFRIPKPRLFWTGLLILITIALIVNLILPSFFSPRFMEVPYSQFVKDVESGEVTEALIGSDRIQYIKKAPPLNGQKRFQLLATKPIPIDLELPKILRTHQVIFSAAKPPENAWVGVLFNWVVNLILPPLVFLGIWIWFMNRSQPGGSFLSFGKSKARVYSEGKTGILFDDVAGVDEAKTELQEIVDFLKNAVKYTRLGAKIPKGLLLVGPPGTGKTLLAKAIAGEAGVPFFSISGSEFIELFVGVGASRVRDLFEQAKNQAPCIIFIDELDALGKSRSTGTGGNDEREQTLNQLLTEMDGFDPNSGVIMVAATNRPEVLDPALRRPGRFDRQVVVDRPDKIGREAILKVHSKNVKLNPNVDLNLIAGRTSGFAGADLANLVNEAALMAARQNQETVRMTDFNEAIERVIAGLERKSRVLNELEKKIVAYHEVGHAIVGALMPQGSQVQKISIVPRGVGALGYTIQMPEEDRFLILEDELRGQIATLLGGRSSEEIVFKKVSTGAYDDIQKATDLAERAITLYGMSQVLGPIAFEKNQSLFLDGSKNPRRPVSPKIAQEIDHQVKEIIDNAHQIALSILEKNRHLLEEIAQILLNQEILEGEMLQSKLKLAQPPEGLVEWLTTGKPLLTKKPL